MKAYTWQPCRRAIPVSRQLVRQFATTPDAAPKAKETEKKPANSENSDPREEKTQPRRSRQGAPEFEGLKHAVWMSASAHKAQRIAPNLWPKVGEGSEKIYEPYDFSYKKATEPVWKQQLNVKQADKFAVNRVNPLSLWKDPNVLSQYITTNGKIIPGYMHGTKGKNHKRLAKAIRRCRAAGMLSYVHRSVDQL